MLIPWQYASCCWFLSLSQMQRRRGRKSPRPSKTEAVSRGTVDALVSEAADLEKGGRFAESEKLLSGALKRFSEPESQKRLAIAQADLHFSWGYALEKKYAFEEAIAHYTAALEIDKQYRRDRAAIDINNIGAVLFRAGQFEEAIKCYEQSLVIRREVRDRAGEGRVLDNLGTAHYNLGYFEKALAYYRQALVIRREVGDAKGEVTTLVKIGNVYGQFGQPEEAIGSYEQALTVARTATDPAGEASTLNNLGGAYASLGKFQKAIPYFERALKIQRQVKDRQGENATLYNLGQAYGFTGKLDNATGYLEQALAKARETQDILGEGAALTRLMAAWQARRKPQRAIFYGKMAVNVWQKMRTDLQKLDREIRESFFEDKAQTYRDLADLLASQGRLEEAQQILWMLKDEEYLEFVRGDAMAAPPQAGGAPELSPLERSWEQCYSELGGQVAANGARRAALLTKETLTPPERQELEHLEEDAQVSMRAFQKALGELANAFDTPQQAADKVAELRESEGLMQDLRDLGQGVVALQTIMGRDKYRVILITPDIIKQGEYPMTRSELERKVGAFCAELCDPHSDPLPLAQELYKDPHRSCGRRARGCAGADAHVVARRQAALPADQRAPRREEIRGRALSHRDFHVGQQTAIEGYADLEVDSIGFGRVKTGIGF
jgi:tetratricopeptide (TPR) repeat protein